MNATATESATRHRRPVLVVGVGSELRCDDAAGRVVAERVADRRLRDVEVRSVHQLTPELAAAIAERELVIVVDASVEVAEPRVAVVDAAAPPASFSHHLDVRTLLELSALLSGPPRCLVTVAIPAHDLGLGTSLSAETSAWLDQIVEDVVARCTSREPPTRSRPAQP